MASEPPSDAESFGSVGSGVLKDETARRILTLLKMKDVEIKKLEEQKRKLEREGEEKTTLLEETNQQLNTSVAARHGDQTLADKAKTDLVFTTSECHALSVDKNVLLKQLRGELEKSRVLEAERDQSATVALSNAEKITSLHQEVAYQKQLIENLTQRVQLHEEDAKDLEEEKDHKEKKITMMQVNFTKRESELKIEIEGLKSQLTEQTSQRTEEVTEAEKLKKSHTISSRENTTLKAEVKMKNDEIAELQQEVAEMELTARQVADEHAAQLGEMTERTQHMELFSIEIQNFQRKLEEATESLHLVEADKDNLQQTADRLLLEKTTLEEHIEHLKAQLATFDTAANDHQAQCNTAQREVHDLKSKMRMQSAALEEANNTLSMVRAEQEHLLNEAMKAAQLDAALQNLERILEETRGEKDIAEETAAMHQNNLLDVHRTFAEHQSQYQSEVNEVQTKLAEAECALKVRNGQVEGLKIKLTQSEERVKELEEEQIRVEQLLSDAEVGQSEARGNYLKAQKTVKKLKTERERDHAAKHDLQRTYKELSSKRVCEMKQLQEFASLMTQRKEESDEKIEQCNKKNQLLSVKIQHLEDKARVVQRSHEEELTKLEEVIKTLRRDLMSRHSAGDVAAREKEELVSDVSSLRQIIVQLREEVREGNEARLVSAKTVAGLKRQVVHGENVKKSLEGKLESQVKQEKTRLKQIDAAGRQAREDDKRRHEVTVELRKDKTRLVEELAEMASELAKVEERNKVLQSSSARNMKTVAELREKTGAGRVKGEGVERAVEWQEFVMAQLMSFVRFLLHSNLEVITKIKDLQQSKEDCLLSPLSLFDHSDSRTILDETLLTPDHYGNLLRTSTGYTRGTLAAPPKLKISGGLRESKRTQDLATTLTTLVTRRIKLEAKLADVTAM